MKWTAYINRVSRGAVKTSKHVVEIVGLSRSDTAMARRLIAKHFRAADSKVMAVPTPQVDQGARVEAVLVATRLHHGDIRDRGKKTTALCTPCGVVHLPNDGTPVHTGPRSADARSSFEWRYETAPHGWQNWSKAEKHPDFIAWAEPAPTSDSESRYAVVIYNNSIRWARVPPTPDASIRHVSSGAFYEDMTPGMSGRAAAVEAAKRSAMVHKAKMRALLARR